MLLIVQEDIIKTVDSLNGNHAISASQEDSQSDIEQ
jgi:hypothetical protein